MNVDGFGRGTSPGAEALSAALRHGRSAELTRRRRTAALSLASIGALGVVAAYQHGLLEHIPEPPLPFLDADAVDASGEAYQLLRVPDASLGIASAAATLVLAGMARDGRRWLPVALAVKTVADAVGGVVLTAEQATRHRRFCSWCLLAAALQIAAVPQTLPGALAALRTARRA